LTTIAPIIEKLLASDRILILTHQSPDGDTLGSAFALAAALRQKGKKARIECSDPFPAQYSFMFGDYREEEFSPDLIVAVDIATPNLLGKKLSIYAEKVDVCIDHHHSNPRYAALSWVEGEAAATCELIFRLVCEMGCEIDTEIATSLYTGIATDTGCFKYQNTTAQTHRIAADLLEKGIDYAEINRKMFDTKSPARIAVEREVLRTMEYFFDKKCALIVIPRALLTEYGATESELEGLANIPRQIEGVTAGVTIRERENGIYKISVRTNGDMDASAVCAQLGGGGHRGAAGCTCNLPLAQTKEMIVAAVGKILGE